MDKKKVLIAAPVHRTLIDRLSDMGYDCVIHDHITQGEAIHLIADCTGVITSTRLHLNKELIDAAPLLRWIGRMGSGMEIIDLAYAKDKNITCFSSPDGICNAVGEHAIGMLLNVMHRIAHSNNELKQGTWLREENRGMELEGSTVGIIGFGHTGRAFAEKLQGFGVHIIAYDKYVDNNFPGYVESSGSSINSILHKAGIISFHVPLNDETYHYCNDRFMDEMDHPFILINTSRGGVVDTHTIYKGLKTGKIVAACLDVFEQEPIDFHANSIVNEIIAMPNVIATPHIAGYTQQALFKMSLSLAEQIKTYLNELG